MTAYISDALRREVVLRAGQCCEYCLVHQSDRLFSHEIDHIIAEKHGGQSVIDNLCVACSECNRYKGSDLCSFDELTQTVVPLFSPRIQQWADHFRLAGGFIEGLSPSGRVTVRLLQLNRVDTVERRLLLMKLGRYPTG